MTPPTILHCHGNVFTQLLASNDREIHTHMHTTQQFFYFCIYLLPQEHASHCLAMIGEVHIQTHTDVWDLWRMPLTWAQMSYIYQFHKDLFRHSKVSMGGFTDTDSISLLNFFKIRKVAWKQLCILQNTMLNKMDIVVIILCSYK
jgi:hypothetical protein